MAKKTKEKAVSRKRAYELDGMMPLPGGQGAVNPLSAIEAQEAQDLASEYNSLRMEELITKRRQAVDRLKGGTLGGEALASNADFMKMARLMADLDPDEQKRVANAYATLRMATKGQLGDSLQYLAPLLGYARQNPGASENDMIKYLTLMDSQFSKGLTLAREMAPKQTEDDSTLKFLGIMKDLVVEGVRNPVLQAIEKAQPHPSAFEQILMNPELFTRFTGMFGGGGAAKGQFDLEIEKLRGERDLNNRKMDLQWKKDLLERESKDKQTENIMTALGPLATLLAGPVAQRMQHLGEQQGAVGAGYTPMPNPAPLNPVQQGETTILLQCTCGHKETMTFPGEPPSVINCPACNIELKIGGTPQ